MLKNDTSKYITFFDPDSIFFEVENIKPDLKEVKKEYIRLYDNPLKKQIDFVQNLISSNSKQNKIEFIDLPKKIEDGDFLPKKAIIFS